MNLLLILILLTQSLTIMTEMLSLLRFIAYHSLYSKRHDDWYDKVAVDRSEEYITQP